MNSWLLLELFIDFGLPMLLALVGAILLWRAYPHRSKKGTPICPACRYNLTGSTSETCPECGADLTANWRTSFKFTGKKKAVVGLVLIIPMLWVLWMSVSYYSWAVPRHYRLEPLQKVQPSGAEISIDRNMIRIREDDTVPRFLDSPSLWVAVRFTQTWVSIFPQLTIGPNFHVSPARHAKTTLERRYFRLGPMDDMSSQAYQICLFVWQAVTRPDMHYRRYFFPDDESVISVRLRHVTASDMTAIKALSEIGVVDSLLASNSKIDTALIEFICQLPISRSLSLDGVIAPAGDFAHFGNLAQIKKLEIVFARPIQPSDLNVISSLPELKRVRIISRTGPMGSECDQALARLIRKPELKILEIPVILTGHPQTTGALGDPQVKDRVTISETDANDDAEGFLFVVTED